MKKRRQGSTLIIVVIIFMFVCVVSFSFLSMVTSNYYARISESKRSQNLYGAESGLDATYNIIAKNIEAANMVAYDKVEDMKKDVEEKLNESGESQNVTLYKINGNREKNLYALYCDIDYWKYYNGNIGDNDEPKAEADIQKYVKQDEEDIYKFINYVFKEEFEKYIKEKLKVSINDGIYEEYTTNNTLTKEKIDRGDAIISLEDGTSEYYDDGIEYVKSPVNAFPSKRSMQVEDGYSLDGRIKYSVKDSEKDFGLNIIYYDEEKCNITVTSEFETDPSKENIIKSGSNKRIIQATYSIRIPNYDEVGVRESIVNLQPKDIPGFTVGRDLNIENANLIVNGDIFVQGLEPDISNIDERTYKKYDSGIKVNNSNYIKSRVSFNDNVFTRETFNIKNNLEVNIKGNLYAKNIYAGQSENEEYSNNSSLTIKNEAVIDNDLAVKAKRTSIQIKNLYGISDITYNDIDKFRKSSSIIINNYKLSESDASNITIENNAYIAGVAHINTENGYQTGESVAVKGNYNAYSVPIDEENNIGNDNFYPYNDRFSYNNNNPLQLLDSDSIEQKSNHFYQYWKNKLIGDNSVDCGGVIFENINNVYSIGSLVYKIKDKNEKRVKKPNYTMENFSNDSVIMEKRREYAKNVYTIFRDKSKLTNDELYKLYNGIESNPETVDKMLENVFDYEATDRENDGKKFAMFCSHSNQNIVIQGNNSTGVYTDDDIKIDASSNKDVKAVIVTNGKVIIDGDVNFRGDIITEGDLDILGSGTVNLYYDENVIKDIQNSYGDIFKSVFGDDFGGEELNNNNSSIESNAGYFLQSKSWRIIPNNLGGDDY